MLNSNKLLPQVCLEGLPASFLTHFLSRHSGCYLQVLCDIFPTVIKVELHARLEMREMRGSQAICLMVGLFVSAQAVSQAVNIEFGTVKRIMIDDTRFGGCAAVISPGPQTVAPSCADNWVTFDCQANFAEAGSTKAGARDKLQAAQLALVTGKQVIVRINPDLTANGLTCYATTIQNLPN